MTHGRNIDRVVTTLRFSASQRCVVNCLCCLCCLLFMSVAGPGSLLAAPRPNVVLIMADDLGYETIGANGGTSYKTPTLDRLPAGGRGVTHCVLQPPSPP